ncbi:MAG: ATP-binding protein [Chlorobium sp.]
MPSLFPYPGLRPFHSDEADIFFGREAQTDELLLKLSQTRFLGVVGPSGCGKSSLVLAGMISALESGFMVTAGSRWKIAQMRPGSHPLRCLAEALMHKEALGDQRIGEHALPFLEATLQRGPRGLIDALAETPLEPGTNLLLLVDQFEELFRFRNDRNSNEQDAFIALLLETVAQSGLSVYLVITMRSDYLGDCALFPGLPEALNQSQYLTPRLSREQREAAIIGPAQVFGGDVDAALLNQLLNETGNDPNQLPVLQHLLMRMWSSTKPSRPVKPGNPFFAGIPEENLGHVLGLSDYEQVGGIAGALSGHADQAYGNLNNEQKRVAEILFRSLCERGSARRDGRHPTAVGIIAERAGVTPEKIIEIVELFRHPLYGFLAPAFPEKLFADTIIDITHESLIKLWKQLSKWVDKEFKSAETYRFLEKSAQRWKDGKGALWGTPDLEQALAWKELEQPSERWAERYGGNFQLALEFLEASKTQEESKKVEERRRQQSQLRKTRRLLTASIIAIITGVIATSLFLYLKVIPYHSYCRNFTKRWGVIYPVGPLSGDAVAHRPWTLKLTRNGRLNPVQSVEVIDVNEKPTPNHPISTYLSDEDNTELAEKPTRYEFVYDRHGKIVYEVAWDRFNRKSWTFVHIPSSQKGKASTKGFFVDSQGYPKPQGHSRAEIVEIQYDNRGFETILKYYDRKGEPQPGPDNAYGVQLTYDDMGREIRRTSLNEQGKPINDDFGNAGLDWKYDSEGNQIEADAFDAKGDPTIVKSGYYAGTHAYDKWGNEVERRYFGLSGEPVIETEQYNAHKITVDYDGRGNCTSIKLFDTFDKPVVAQAGSYAFPAHEQRYTYNSNNKLETVSYYDVSGKPVNGPDGWNKQKYEYDSNGFNCAATTLGATGSFVATRSGFCRTEWVNDGFGRKIEERFFDANHKSAVNTEGYHCRKIGYDRAGNVIKEAYFDTGNMPVPDKSNGVPCILRTFDLFRHCKSVQFTDPSGKPVNGREHFSLVNYEYDRYGSSNATRWFDKDNNPCKGSNGVHCVKMSYGSYPGLITEEKRYDTKDNPIVGYDGIHEILCEYIDKRQQTKWQCFGLNRKPAESKEGDHLVESQYDDKGRSISFSRLRADGSPNIDRDLGIAKWTMVYNRENKWTEQAFYDARNRLVTGPYGYAKGTIVYHPEGGTEICSYGVDGNLNFNPLDGCAIKYDGPLKQSYYGTDRKLINGPYGFAEQRMRRDEKGNLLSTEWFGPDGKPVVGPSGYHRIVQSADGRTVRNFDTENRSITSSGTYIFVPVMFIEKIEDFKQPAVKIGLCAGDVIWKYGDWSFPAAFAAEQAKGTKNDKILAAVLQAFLNEKNQRSGERVSMTVLRHGQPIEILVPPLSGQSLGIKLSSRQVPLATFERWKSMSLRR